MSKVVTPPDIVNEPPVYLIVNAPIDDIKILSHWLRIEEKDYTIHLYHRGMEDPDWIKVIVDSAEHILIHKDNSATSMLEPMLDHVSKIIWFGKNEKYLRVIDYFLNNVRQHNQ